MPTFEDFEEDLREALTHLYDPIYEPTPLLRSVVRGHTLPGTESVQELVKRAIERLCPGDDVPISARARRIYELLRCRYVRELTQEETANRLGISPRHLRREQQQAVHVLAQRLWEQRPQPQPSTGTSRIEMIPNLSASPDGPPGPDAPLGLDGTDDTEATVGEDGRWRSQIHQELAALDRSDPNAVAVVADAVEHVQRLEQALPSGCTIELVNGPLDRALTVRLHPSLLRQVLLVAVQKLRERSTEGIVRLEVRRQDGVVHVHLSTKSLNDGTPPPRSSFVQEVLQAVGGEVRFSRVADSLTVDMALPYASGVTVLVVEDNADLVHFYRRYTDRTRYQIAHICEGTQVFEAIDTYQPGIIVLDVMLSDMDGWEILTLLHSTARTRSIPVIVCSVIRQEELALGLGASLYIPKPVGRQDFIQALDRVLPLATTATQTAPKNNAAAS